MCEFFDHFYHIFINLSYSFNDIQGALNVRNRPLAALQDTQIAENPPLDRDEIIERYHVWVDCFPKHEMGLLVCGFHESSHGID